MWGYQYRPDSPRVTKAGTVIKYETPKGQQNGIDIPSGVRDAVGDPSVPLLVTEGSAQGRRRSLGGAGVRVAERRVGLARPELPGAALAAVADWHDLALNGRRVVLAFDSDVRRKPKVQQALAELGGYLATKGANVEYLHLPDRTATARAGSMTTSPRTAPTA